MRRKGTARNALILVVALTLVASGFLAHAATSDGARSRTLDLLPGGATERDDPAAYSGHEGHDHDAPAGGPATSGGAIAPHGFNVSSPPDLSHTPPFAVEEGTIPSKSEALEFANRYNSFTAVGNEGLERLRSEGYLTGAGTLVDPYVLENFYVKGDLTVASAGKALIVRNGWVGGQLSLNYVGEALYVHHVYASDLRINENVERNGTNTGGLFEHNEFGFVGQIRHFTGEFRENVIGPRPRGVLEEFLGDTGIIRIGDGVVFNFDGFHGADVHDNTFKGIVDVKLHGHNHGDCFVCPVHDHTDAREFPGGEHDHEYTDPTLSALGFKSRHSIRYHSLLFRDNAIEVPSGLALRYNDRNHAGDDQTANSETNERLEDDHVHFQDVTFKGNTLRGGTLQLEIFNAQDELHTTQNRGILRLLENDLTVRYRAQDANRVAGMLLSNGDGLELLARANVVRFEELPDERPGGFLVSAFEKAPERVGFLLARMTAGNLTLEENVVEQGELGAWANILHEDVHWWLLANDFRTANDWRGRDVANPPEEA